MDAPNLPDNVSIAARGGRAPNHESCVIVNDEALQIVGIDPERGFGGGETQVMGLTLALIRAGHRADLLCDPVGALWRQATEAGIGCRPLTVRNSIDLTAGLRLRRLLQGGTYDVIHFHTARAHALAPYARGLARALVVTRRMDYVPNRLFAPRLYNRAVDGVAAISAGVAEALTRGGVSRERIRIIASGVDCVRFTPPAPAQRESARARLGLGADEIALGTVGALTPRKGHRTLLEAMRLIGASGGMRVRCFIAGAGPLRESLAHEIERMAVGAEVRMLGQLDDPLLILGALDIFAMPSMAEGLGVAALEAMASGIPVIASAVGGLREAVEDGRSGILVAPGDARALADGISRLAASPELRAAMGAAGRAAALAHFSLETMAARTLELYRECLETARSGRGQKG
jgi:glycosyltransferase involved in cell wall biosynthesis